MAISPSLPIPPDKITPHEIVVSADMPMSPHRAERKEAEVHWLTSAVASGDEAAFQELYDRYQARLFRLAVVLSRGDESLAHETVQSAMLTAARKLRPLETEEHVWNWLARVARQHLTKAWRRQQREPNVVSLAELPEASELAKSDSVLEESLDAAVNLLDGDDRQVVELFYYEALSQKEIADRLGSSVKAVSNRLERARTRIRSLIEKRLRYET